MSQGNKNTKINKITIRSQVKNIIQEQIQTGRYKPGDRILEGGLAKDLNVSQAPVREAMLELSAMGLLEEIPYCGTFVRKLSADDIEDIYNVRAFIEEYATRRAAKLLTEEELAMFLPILERLEDAAEINDLDSFNEADVDFHKMIINGAKSKALKRTWETLQLGAWTSFTLKATKRPLTDLLAEHKAIYSHLLNRSDHSAGSSMFLHIKNFTNDLVSYMSTKEHNSKEED